MTELRDLATGPLHLFSSSRLLRRETNLLVTLRLDKLWLSQVRYYYQKRELSLDLSRGSLI